MEKYEEYRSHYVETIRFIAKRFNIQDKADPIIYIDSDLYSAKFVHTRVNLEDYIYFVAENNLIDSTFEETYILFILSKG